MAKKKASTGTVKALPKLEQAKRKLKSQPNDESIVLARPGDAVDVDVRTESDRHLVLDGCYGLSNDEPRMQSDRRLVESGLRIVLPFEGGGMLARFRLGAADTQEETAWFARVEGWLDLTNGWLTYGSSSGPPIRVPSGVYHVEISCLTHSWAHFLLGKAFGERIQEYVEQAVGESESQDVEVIIRLSKLQGGRPKLRLDRTGCALVDNWQVRIPLPSKIPIATLVHFGGCG